MNATPFPLKKSLKWIFLFLLLTDLVYSFYQYLQEPLDGDIAPIVLPSDWYAPVMSDPFGWAVLTRGERYAATNRYFTHWSISNWFKTAPFFFQRFTDPVQAIYWACAIFKIVVHLLLLYLLAALISARRNPLEFDFILAALLLAPLFQANGYAAYMGVISPSIIYTFFYAFPMALLLWWLSPFLQALQTKDGWAGLRFPLLQKILAFLLLVFLSFNGPLVQPVVLLLLPGLLLLQGWKQIGKLNVGDWSGKISALIHQYPRLPLLCFASFILCALYSFYIGTYNAENAVGVSKSVAERFALLPKGLFYLFTEKIGAALLLLAVLANSLLLSRLREDKQAKRLLRVFSWILLLSILYILLLPLGGYREYRPFILRADTFLPVTLSLFYCFGASSLLLLKKTEYFRRRIYAAGLGLVLLIFTLADEPASGKNHCEQQALYEISVADSAVVALEQDCLVMSWVPVLTPEESELNSRLLCFWQLTDKPKLYFQNIVSEK